MRIIAGAMLVFALLSGPASAVPRPSAPPARSALVNFAVPAAVLQIRSELSRYHGPIASGCTDWYMTSVGNDAELPATRVLQAGTPAGTGLGFYPAHTRPQIAEVAASDAAVSVERESAYGRSTFRVTVPAATRITLAFCFSNAHKPPSLLAWTEPALAQHNRNLAIFVAAVAGLIGACAAIVAGLAALSGHAAPRWAALALLLVLLARLSATGVFDSSLATSLGGPYGLMALLGGLALAAGARLADAVVPVRDFEPALKLPFRIATLAIVAISFLAYLGMPGAALLTDLALIFGTAAIAAWLVHCGRLGSQPARMLAPSATVFALVVLAAAATALGGYADSAIAGDAAGGFAAAGAVLLALAIAADERFQAARGAGPFAVKNIPTALPRAGSLTVQMADAVALSHQSVFELDFDSDLLTLSDDAAELVGGRPRIAHRDWLSRVHPEDRPVYERAFEDYRTQPGLAFRLEFRVHADDGRTPWLELRATMQGEDGLAARCSGLIADVTARKETDAAQLERTLRDPLTGLGNRVALMEELEQLGTGLTNANFALLDLDRFKTIHASLGDNGADRILKKLAQRLSDRFGSLAQYFRVGGDSFALVFVDCREEPSQIGAQLVEICGLAYSQRGREVFAPASVGVTRGRDAQDPLELLKNAELALLQAKRQGGACARTYSPDLAEQAPGDAVALEAELRHALDVGQLDVFYQPIVRLSDRSVAGFEALLRWRHPTKGLVSPSEFVPHAEETGLIVELGRFALGRATRDLGNWQRFFPTSRPLFVSVNVSRRQLRDEGFESQVVEALSNAELKRGTLKLEITESALATNPNAPAILRKLKKLGAGLAIDDFGTGVSSLSQLKDLPFDTVKIDKSFLARHGGTHADVEGSVILTSIVSLAHELKRSVVVEGVEDERDAKWLRELGCEFAQGFHFARPLPANEALSFIAMQSDGDAAKPSPTRAARTSG